jgi:chromosome segregation ATPase
MTLEREAEIRANLETYCPHEAPIISELLGSLEKLRREFSEYKTHYDRIFERSIVIASEEYEKLIISRSKCMEALAAAQVTLEETEQVIDDLHQEITNIKEA